MIVERFPELKMLNSNKQLELASELAKEALKSDQKNADISDSSLKVMEERLDYFIEHPKSGTAWEELRKKKNA